MIHLRLFLRTMLSLPVVRDAQTHYVITFCIIAYFILLLLVLKTFQFNKDRFEK